MPESLDSMGLPWWMLATSDELLDDLRDRPWFMYAEVDDVLKPTVDELLGGRKDELDVWTGGKLTPWYK